MAKPKGNPWLGIWTEPRKTIRSIIDVDPKFRLFLLCAIYGLPIALNFSQSFSLIEDLPVWTILIGSLVVCPFLGIIGISISTYLLQVVGKWLGGRGKFQTIRACVAWSNVPNVVTVLMWLLLLWIFGRQIFDKHFSETPFVGYQSGIIFLVMLIETIVSIWGLIILLSTLSEVQGFSIWRALLNVLIPFVAVVIIVWGAGWLLAGQ